MASERSHAALRIAAAVLVGLVLSSWALENARAAGPTDKPTPVPPRVAPTVPLLPPVDRRLPEHRGLKRPAVPADLTCTGKCASTRDRCQARCAEGGVVGCAQRCRNFYTGCVNKCGLRSPR